MKKIITTVVIAFCINVNAQIITTVAGNGINSYGGDGSAAISAELSNPYNTAFDAAGNMYIADYNNNRIRMVTTAGTISTIAGNGTAGFSGDGAQATNAELNAPQNMVFDAAGNMYISDYLNMRVRKVTTAGIITTMAGNGISSYSGDGGAATAAGINAPRAVAFDGAGNIYIVDYGDSRIRKVTSSGIITTVAGNGTAGYSGDGGAATAAELYNPTGLSLDAAGNMYISDFNNNRIRKVTTAGIISTFAGTGTAGFSGDGAIATNAELDWPTGITLDGVGNLYIADFDNSRIRKVTTAGIISTIAGSGTSGFSGDGSTATNAELAAPTGVSFDALGNLYIADYSNNRIRKVTNVGQMTSIEQIANSNNIEVNIYPNPNNGNFVIELQNTLYNVHCTVYDVNGKQVLTQTINGKTTVDASSLNEGVYQLSIQNSDFRITKRLVIVR